MGPRATPWLIAILAVGILLRAAGLDWGLPGDAFHFPFHPDEMRNVSEPRHMLRTGELNPQFLNYGSLWFYVVWIVYLPCSWLGLLETPANLFTVARLVNVACAASTIWLTYRMGSRMISVRGGLIAAAAIAVAPGHVMHSSFATVESLSGLLAVASLWFALRHCEEHSMWTLAAAAACTGLAASTKYPVGLVGLGTITALVISNRRSPGRLARSSATLVACGAGGFLVGCPSVLFDFGEFWKDMSYEIFEHSNDGASGHAAAGWINLTTATLPYMLGPALAVASLPGLVLLARNRSRQSLPMLSFAAAFVVLLGCTSLSFMRYAFPLVPVFCIAAAMSLQHVGAFRGGVATAVALVAFAIPGAVQSACFLRPDSRLAAVQFARTNIAERSKVGVLEHPDWFSAPLSRFNAGKPPQAYGKTDGDRWKLLAATSWTHPTLREEPEWFVVSEYPLRHVRPGPLTLMLETRYTLAHDYSAFPRRWRWLFGSTNTPHDWLYPFPAIRIYRRIDATERARSRGAAAATPTFSPVK